MEFFPPVSFYLYKTWLLVILRLGMGLTVCFCWTALPWSLPQTAKDWIACNHRALFTRGLLSNLLGQEVCSSRKQTKGRVSEKGVDKTISQGI